MEDGVVIGVVGSNTNKPLESSIPKLTLELMPVSVIISVSLRLIFLFFDPGSCDIKK